MTNLGKRRKKRAPAKDVTCDPMKLYFRAAQLGLCFGPITFLWVMAILATVGNISGDEENILVAKSLTLIMGGGVGLLGVGSIFTSFINNKGVTTGKFYRNVFFVILGIFTLWFGLHKEAGFTLKAMLMLYLPICCSLHFVYLHFGEYRQIRNK